MITLEDVKNNVDNSKKVIYTPQAKEHLDLLRNNNTYGKISASNVIFLTKDKSIK